MALTYPEILAKIASLQDNVSGRISAEGLKDVLNAMADFEAFYTPFSAVIPFAAGINASAVAPQTIVDYNSALWICIVPHLTTSTFVPANWAQFSPSSAELTAAIAQAQAAQAGAELAQTGAQTAQGLAETAQAGAETARTGAENARDAALLSRGIFSTTAEAIGLGIAGHGTVTAGSGGANGRFPLAFTGGTGSGAAGSFLVVGGALDPNGIIITAPGSYTVAPTFDFSASAGLTGAAAPVVLGNNVDIGEYFSTPVANSDNMFLLWKVIAGPTAQQIGPYATGEGLLSMLVGLQDTSVATTALTASRSYATNTPSLLDGYVRKVHIYSIVARPVRIFVADSVGGNLKLVRYININTAGIGGETITLGDELPIAEGQIPGCYFEVGAPYYVAGTSDGLMTVAGGFITAAGLAFTSNTTLTLALGFEIEGTARYELTRNVDQVAAGMQDWVNNTWTAFGTSITSPGYYAAEVAAKLGAALVNFGASGQTWCQAGSGSGIIYKRALRADPRSQFLTLEGPINDFRLDIPLGAVRDTSATTNCLGAFYTIINDWLEANPYRSVALLLSPPNMDAGHAGKWNAANGNGVFWNTYIETLEQQARWMNIEVIRPYNMNGITCKWDEADLLHPDQYTGATKAARAYAFGMKAMPKSDVIQCATPVVAFDIGTGLVTITCATAGVTIRYTTDGSNPTTSSTVYAGAFTPADGDTEIRAVAIKSGLGRSPQRRMTVTKNTTSGLGGGTWNLQPAVIADITSTRGVVGTLEGGLNWSVDVEPAPTNNTAIWLASGSNNACEFEVAYGDGFEMNIIVGLGASGWLAIGWFRLTSANVNRKLLYELATGVNSSANTFAPNLNHPSANEPTRIYRVARIGNIVSMYENIYGVWSTITSGLDLSTLTGVAGYYETNQLGVVQDVAKTNCYIKNVRVGTLV